jgi:glucose-1-phosphate thymidylyltransferase
LEITDVNLAYLEMGQLHVCKVNRGFAWLDAGTGRSLYKASSYIRTAEKRFGKKIGCPEEMAFRRGLIDAQQFAALISKMPHSDYREYLERSTVNAGSRSNRRNPSKATISTTSCSSRFHPRVRKPLKKNRSPILA